MMWDWAIELRSTASRHYPSVCIISSTSVYLKTKPLTGIPICARPPTGKSFSKSFSSQFKILITKYISPALPSPKRSRYELIYERQVTHSLSAGDYVIYAVPLRLCRNATRADSPWDSDG